MSKCVALGTAICCALTSAAVRGESAERGTHEIPEWTRGARWYQVDVDRFRNGDPSNDPVDVLPFQTAWAPAEATAEWSSDRPAGGDLKGLESKLPYLKQFGINALYLTPILTEDLRHVAECFGVKGVLGDVAGEDVEPATWKFSAGDRVFLGFLKEAHRQGFRVVVDAGSIGGAEHLLKVARRWLDPDGDGDPSDGLDGWVLQTDEECNPALGERLRAQVKTINAKAILIAHPPYAARERVEGDWFDVAISYEAGEVMRRFLSGRDETYTLENFFHDLGTVRKRHDPDTWAGTLSAVSGPDAGRLLSGLMPSHAPAAGEASSSASLKPTEASYDRWRLATVFHHFHLGAPVTYYGDEVGMYGSAGSAARAPMWWDDLSNPPVRPPLYRGDFRELIRLMNVRREVDAPLRRGGFRQILLDQKRKILAFARTLPGDEVILVMNYGNDKQRVKIAAGRPAQMIGMLSPQLRPARESASPGMGAGSRQRADQSGQVSIWVKPMSVRIVLVKENEGR